MAGQTAGQDCCRSHQDADFGGHVACEHGVICVYFLTDSAVGDIARYRVMAGKIY